MAARCRWTCSRRASMPGSPPPGPRPARRWRPRGRHERCICNRFARRRIQRRMRPRHADEEAMRTVLVIDDNPAVGTALELLLGLREIRTLVALGPAEGLELIEREDVDLVVQDMNFAADTTSGEE